MIAWSRHQMTTSRLLCRAFDCIGALSSRIYHGLCCPGRSKPFENHREQSRHPSSLTLGDNQKECYTKSKETTVRSGSNETGESEKEKLLEHLPISMCWPIGYDAGTSAALYQPELCKKTCHLPASSRRISSPEHEFSVFVDRSRGCSSVV